MSTAARDLSCPSATTLSQFLHDELAGNEAAAVEVHVDDCPVCQEVMAGLVNDVTGPVDVLTSLSEADPRAADTLSPSQGSPDPYVPPPPPAPIEVPGYEILDVLGRGGMGVVYKARQLRPNRTVALKMLLSGRHASTKERDRFLREAGAVAQLQHPYIVSLHEAGEQGDLPYLTFEYISGGSLSDWLRLTPLAPHDAARIVEQLARGMHYAHERGILHRDLKPANVLLQFADLSLSHADGNAPVPSENAAQRFQSAIPRITDFGLAKDLSGGHELTSTNMVCGTPSYMAPEQAGSSPEGVGVSADVYALGAILYECITGRPPFRAPTAAETLMQVMSDDPPPPSRLQRSVPPDLQTICLKCLQKKPRQRYASALELAEDLRRYQAGEAIRARPVGRWERVVKWCRRRPAVAALLATVVFLTVLAGGLITWQWRAAVAALAEARLEKAARAQRQVLALPDAAPASVPAILEELQANRDEVLPLLRQRYEKENARLRKMRLALALLPTDPQSLRGPLTDWMLHANEPAEVLLAREALRPHGQELAPMLWKTAEDAETPGNIRFRALVALADYAPTDARWQKLGAIAVEHLLWSNPLHRGLWNEALGSLGDILAAPLADASYFPLKLGMKWHYRVETRDGKTGDGKTGDGKLLKISSQIAKVEEIDGQLLARLEFSVMGEAMASEHLRSTAQGVFRHRYNGTEISPPMRILSFPIQVGEAWESEHRVGKKILKVNVKIGSEEIEVPAGKFKTITLHLQTLEKEGGISTTFWLAPGIGIVKQTVVEAKSAFTSLLEKFEPGEGD